ncbi:MAG: 50S ribosomal protein L11 methyltransferase [Promethearchaeota archaeon]
MAKRDFITPFSLLHAASLLSQRTRLSKFRNAISQVVNDSSYVVDIGTGTGVLALLAAQAGARRVTGIDVNSNSIDYAREAAARNGLQERVEFQVANFTEFVPSEPADVVICEMLSSMMLVEHQVSASHYAVKSILKSGGTILPRNATVFVCPVECHSLWNRMHVHGLDFPRLPQTTNSVESRDLANLEVLKEFDFTSVARTQSVDQLVEFMIEDSGTVHGIAGMFEAELVDGIKLTMQDGWRILFLPLGEPVNVTSNSTLGVRIRYTPGVLESLQIEITRIH